MSPTGHRPFGAHDRTDEKSTDKKSTDGRGRDPSHGPAAKINQAWNAENRPDEADADLVQAVALRAWNLDVHPSDVWDEVDEAVGGIVP